MAKSGGRIAKIVTKEELIQRIEKEILENKRYNVGILFKKIEKDLKKIDFDFENTTLCGTDFGKSDNEKSNWEINTLENGLTYCMCSAGGDWEWPVSFIVYIDNKNKLRGYIPSEGNVYNKKYKCAYGSEGNNEDYEDDFDDLDINEVDPLNIDLFVKDISNRISVV